jgi:hypothetical protein
MRRVSPPALRGIAVIALALTVLAMGSVACAGRRSLSREEMWGPFRGRFVDADTGEPIRGGVAYAVWFRIVETPVQSNQEFYAVQFALTNDAGDYEIPALPNAPLLSSWYDGPFRSSVVPGHQIVEADEAGGHTVIKWRPFSRIPEAQRRYASAIYTAFIPEERRRDVLEQINVVRRRMGLPPFRSLGGGM